MKVATISAEFAELKGNNLAIGRGQGSTAKAAIARVVADLLKQPNVKRKRVSHINATITIINKTDKVTL